MIQGGVEVLHELGVETQLSSVSYAKVFAHVEKTQGVRVTYGSVHERIWDSLQEYQLAVIRRAGVWDDPDTDATHWADWLRSMVALSSAGADDTVREATLDAAVATYADRGARLQPSEADPSGLVPDAPGADELLAVLSVAIVDGLRLRGLLLSGDESDTANLSELGRSILATWFREHPSTTE